MREGFLHQREAELGIDAARARELFEHLCVVGRIDDDEHVAEILGGGADQARAADVDLFHQRVETRVRILRRLREGIEVDDDQVNRRYPVSGDRFEVVRTGTTCQDAGVDGGMQRLHPAVHHLGEPGDVRDVADGQTGVGERLRRPAGRDQLDPEPIEAFSEIRKARFIRNTQNCTHNWRFT